MTPPLYCKDCRWCRFTPPRSPLPPMLILCTHEESRDAVGLFRLAERMRREGMPCGPSGRLFTLKPPQPKRPIGFFRRLFGAGSGKPPRSC